MASRAILADFFEEQWTQNHLQYLSALSRALFPTTFLEIAVVRALFEPIFLDVFLEKDCNGKKDRCAVFRCNNDRLFPRNIQWSSLFAQKARPWASHNTP